MSLTEAFNTPILIAVGGREYKLAFLTMDDLGEISRETLQEAKLQALAGVGIAKKQEREDVAAYFDALDLDMNELGKQCMTLKGSVRFVRKSVIKGGQSPDDAQKFVDEMTNTEGYLSLGNLACRVSRLFKPAARPNGEAASGTKADAASQTQPTGDNSPESSGEPSVAATPAS